MNSAVDKNLKDSLPSSQCRNSLKKKREKKIIIVGKQSCFINIECWYIHDIVVQVANAVQVEEVKEPNYGEHFFVYTHSISE